MQEFILFERSLILSKDARSPEPCADLYPAASPLIAGTSGNNRRECDESVARFRTSEYSDDRVQPGIPCNYLIVF